MLLFDSFFAEADKLTTQFSVVRNGHITHSRHLAQAPTATHLTRSAYPLTSTFPKGSATACTAARPRHHTFDVEQPQRAALVAAGDVATQPAETMREPADLTIRVVVSGHSITGMSGVSGIQLLRTLADDVDSGGCVWPCAL